MKKLLHVSALRATDTNRWPDYNARWDFNPRGADWRVLGLCLALALCIPPGAMAAPSVALTETSLTIVAEGPFVLWSVEKDMPVVASALWARELPRPPDGIYLVLTFDTERKIHVTPFVVGMPPAWRQWTHV